MAIAYRFILMDACSSLSLMSRIDAQPRDCFGNAFYCRNVGCASQTHLVALGCQQYMVEGVNHDLLQPVVDKVFFPVISLIVLNPFKLGHGHTAGIGENVG